MNRKNIVLIDHEPFTKRRKRIFYINELIELGYHIEVWDLSQLIFPGMHLADEITESYLLKINSIKTLESKLQNCDIDDTVFFIECLSTWQNRKIFHLLAQYNCITIRMDLYANTTIKVPLWKKIKKLCSNSFFKIVNGKISAFTTRLYSKMYHIQIPHYYLSSSRFVNRTNKINHPDYELFKFTDHPSIINQKYIVFLDTYFPYHPDLKYFYNYKINVDVCAERYYGSLNRFFSFLENKYHMPVIIAAHPKSQYQGNEFEGRLIIKNQTDNLVIHASSVLMQTSNAISYITLANKPVAFIATDASNQFRRYKEATKLIASTLGKHVYNIDKGNFNDIKIDQIEKNKRTNYIYSYLTSKETENKRNIDILKSILECINDKSYYHKTPQP